MQDMNINSALSLWEKYVSGKNALFSSGCIRSNRSPESDFAEWLVARFYNGELLPSKSHPYFDVTTEDKRIQVKSLSKASSNQNGYIISKEKDRGNNPKYGATHYAFVFFVNSIPQIIFLVPENYVRNFPKTQIKREDLEIDGVGIETLKIG